MCCSMVAIEPYALVHRSDSHGLDHISTKNRWWQWFLLCVRIVLRVCALLISYDRMNEAVEHMRDQRRVTLAFLAA